MAEKKKDPPRALVKREKPKYAVANPGRIVTHPAFWPSPSKHRLCDRVDPRNGKNTRERARIIRGPIPGRQPATAAIEYLSPALFLGLRRKQQIQLRLRD